MFLALVCANDKGSIVLLTLVRPNENYEYLNRMMLPLMVHCHFTQECICEYLLHVFKDVVVTVAAVLNLEGIDR